MTCENCKARRELLRQAFLQRRMKEMIEQAAKGTAEIAGLKEKTGKADLERASASAKGDSKTKEQKS